MNLDFTQLNKYDSCQFIQFHRQKRMIKAFLEHSIFLCALRREEEVDTFTYIGQNIKDTKKRRFKKAYDCSTQSLWHTSSLPENIICCRSCRKLDKREDTTRIPLLAWNPSQETHEDGKYAA